VAGEPEAVMADPMTKIMTATEPADVAQMAMIECVRQLADNGKAMNKILEGMQAELRDVRERVIRIEASEFKAELTQAKQEIDRLRKEAKDELTDLDSRVERLEAKDHRRDGGQAFADAILKYGPFVITIATALFIVLLTTGRIVL
jgi:uncharacterized protein YukE